MSTPPIVVFRADGSARIGTGHIMRCLTLADEMALRGARCVFVIRGQQEWLTTIAANSEHRLLYLPNLEQNCSSAEADNYSAWLGTSELQDAQDTLLFLSEKEIAPSFVVADHYALGSDWERTVCEATGAKICAIDDLNRNHFCDFLVDTTFAKEPDVYKGRVPPQCKVLTGTRYALLKPTFAALRPATLARRDANFAAGKPVREILISMGGGDAEDATGWILRACANLSDVQNIKLTVLTGGAYPHSQRLAKRAADSAVDVELLHAISDVTPVLARADLAIGASGSSSWERCCLGLPTISVVIADNQNCIANALSAIGAVRFGGRMNVSEVQKNPRAWCENVILPLLNDKAKLRAISQSARSIVDGLGTKCVLNELFV